MSPNVDQTLTLTPGFCPLYLYMETFSMRSAVSVSLMMMPFGDTVSVTLRNFLVPALACERQTQECTCSLMEIRWQTECSCHWGNRQDIPDQVQQWKPVNVLHTERKTVVQRKHPWKWPKRRGEKQERTASSNRDTDNTRAGHPVNGCTPKPSQSENH